MGLKGGCIAGVVLNRGHEELVSVDALKVAEENAIKAAVASIEGM
jgi:hypothetical protein